MQTRLTRCVVLGPVLLLATAVAGCAGLLSEADRNDPAVREEGGRLARKWCTQCHEMIPPRDFTDTEWVVWIRDMSGRAHLTPLQGEKVLLWYQHANDEVPDALGRPAPAGGE